MQMTEQEICKEYREAKDPTHQLTILAQLNCCGKEDIVEILMRNNEPLRKRQYKKKDKPAEPKAEETKKAANRENLKNIPVEDLDLGVKADPVDPEISESVILAVKDRIVWVKLRISELEAELATYRDQYKELNEFVNKHTREVKE